MTTCTFFILDSAPGIFIIESVMEHISKELNLDPTSVRVLNLYNKGQVIKLCNEFFVKCVTFSGRIYINNIIKILNK